MKGPRAEVQQCYSIPLLFVLVSGQTLLKVDFAEKMKITLQIRYSVHDYEAQSLARKHVLERVTTTSCSDTGENSTVPELRTTVALQFYPVNQQQAMEF